MVTDLKLKKIENLYFRGIYGTFYNLEIKNLNQIKKLIDRKFQTATYFGKNAKNDLYNFVYQNNIKGIDRIVPLGQAHEMNYFWDGYDLIRSLTRYIEMR